MGEKDITEKLLEDYPDVFADIFNVLVFNGERRIKEDELSESIVHSQYKAEDGRLHELERDVTKKWLKNNVSLSMFGIENQTAVEKFMPLRVMGYDGASYRSQLLNLASEKRKLQKLRNEGRITEKEYVSKIKKAYNDICPVITIVLYFGTDRHWNESDTLKEILDIPEGLEKFVNDYRVHIFEIAWLSEEQIDMMTSDFKIVAKFFRDKRLGSNNIERDTTKITHIDEILKLLKAVTGDVRYTDILKYDGYKEADNMCELLDRLINEGREQGREQGIEQERARTAVIIKEKEEQLTQKEVQLTEKDAIIEELRKQLAAYQNQ